MAGGPGADECPLPLESVHPGQVVADLVYHPLETPLLRGARARGAEVVDGLGMLVHQASLQIERWTGRAGSGSERCGPRHFTHCSRRPGLLNAPARSSFAASAADGRRRPIERTGRFRPGDAVLQGTLETLALPELLGLLAQSRKTGALWLDAANSSAVIYIVDGRCCAAESSEAGDPLTDGAALLARVIDVCFAVERADDGSFRFGPEEPSWSCPDTVDLEGAIDELGRLVDEWREIQAVIPSLDCRIRLADELGVEELTVDRERWQLIVSLDGRRSVRDLVRKTNRPVLEVCHAILEMVDAGAVNVGPAPAAPLDRPYQRPQARPRSGGRARGAVRPRRRVAPSRPAQRVRERGSDEVDREVDPAEKGRYLSAFSGLREV